jgi:hypothetical protein
MIEPSNVERSELPDTTRVYVEDLERIVDQTVREVKAQALREAATWATNPSGTVSVKRLLDEADKLEGK